MADVEGYSIPIKAQSESVEKASVSIDTLVADLNALKAVAVNMQSVAANSTEGLEGGALAAVDEMQSLNTAIENIEKSLKALNDTNVKVKVPDVEVPDVKPPKKVPDVKIKVKVPKVKVPKVKIPVEPDPKDIAKDVEFLNGKSGELAGAVGKLGGPLGRTGQLGLELVDSFQKLGKSFGVAGSAAVGFAVTLVALGAASLYAYTKLAIFAVESNKKAMTALGKATTALKKDLASLFDGVHVNNFVTQFKEVTAIFKKGTAESNALKLLLETLLNPLFDTKSIGSAFKEMFRGMIWGALQAAIAVVKLRNAILRAVPKETRKQIMDVVSSVDWLKVVFYGGAVVIGVVALALTALAVIVGAIVALLGGFVVLIVSGVVGPFVLLAAAVAAAIASLVSLYNVGKLAVHYLLELASAGASVASNLVGGLIKGIKSGAGKFVAAIKSMMQSGVSAMKSTLGIASASKVAEGITVDFGGGAVKGLFKMMPQVSSAMSRLADPEDFSRGLSSPQDRIGSVAATTSTSTSSANTYNITIQSTGAPEDIIRKLEAFFVGRLHATAVQLAGEAAT